MAAQPQVVQTGVASSTGAPSIATHAVLVQSEDLPADTPVVRGYDFNQGVNYDALFKALASTGFQATHFAQAIEEVNRMVCCSESIVFCIACKQHCDVRI